VGCETDRARQVAHTYTSTPGNVRVVDLGGLGDHLLRRLGLAILGILGGCHRHRLLGWRLVARVIQGGEEVVRLVVPMIASGRCSCVRYSCINRETPKSIMRTPIIVIAHVPSRSVRPTTSGKSRTAVQVRPVQGIPVYLCCCCQPEAIDERGRSLARSLRRIP
jgi:hypothetical protein